MSLTRLTSCLGILILLSGVTAFSRQGEKPELPEEPSVSIPKGGAGILDTADYYVIYDQGRGRGKLISKHTATDGHPDMHEFTIK